LFVLAGRDDPDLLGAVLRMAPWAMVGGGLILGAGFGGHPLRVRHEDDPPHVGTELRLIPALALRGRSALYLFAYVALPLRVARTLSRGRFVTSIAFAVAGAGRCGRAGARRARPRGRGVAHAARL